MTKRNKEHYELIANIAAHLDAEADDEHDKHVNEIMRASAAARRRLFTPVEKELRDLTTALLKRLDTSATAGVVHWPEIPALKKLLDVP